MACIPGGKRMFLCVLLIFLLTGLASPEIVQVCHYDTYCQTLCPTCKQTCQEVRHCELVSVDTPTGGGNTGNDDGGGPGSGGGGGSSHTSNQQCHAAAQSRGRQCINNALSISSQCRAANDQISRDYCRSTITPDTISVSDLIQAHFLGMDLDVCPSMIGGLRPIFTRPCRDDLRQVLAAQQREQCISDMHGGSGQWFAKFKAGFESNGMSIGFEGGSRGNQVTGIDQYCAQQSQSQVQSCQNQQHCDENRCDGSNAGCR